MFVCRFAKIKILTLDPPSPTPSIFCRFWSFFAQFFSETLKTTKNIQISKYPKDLKNLINRKYFESVTRLHVYQDTGPTSGIYCYALRKAQ